MEPENNSTNQEGVQEIKRRIPSDYEATLFRIFKNANPDIDLEGPIKKLVANNNVVEYARFVTSLYQEKTQKALKELIKEKGEQAAFAQLSIDDLIKSVEPSDSELVVWRHKFEEKVKSRQYKEQICKEFEILTDPQTFHDLYWNTDFSAIRNLVPEDLADDDILDGMLRKFARSEDCPIIICLGPRAYSYLDRLDNQHKSTYGFTHIRQLDWKIDQLSIILGHWVLTFNEDGLIIPTISNSKYGHLALGLQSPSGIRLPKSQLPLVCQTIADWNKNKFHTKSQSSDPQYANSLQFVWEVFDKIGVPIKMLPKGPIDSFLQRVNKGIVGDNAFVQDTNGEEYEVTSQPVLYGKGHEIPRTYARATRSGSGDSDFYRELHTLYKIIEHVYEKSDKDIGTSAYRPLIFGDYTTRC